MANYDELKRQMIDSLFGLIEFEKNDNSHEGELSKNNNPQQKVRDLHCAFKLTGETTNEEN